ncbi:hypothetical protein [Amycolatopsis sp. NPDC021455]|uniref:hypothetical protein n=1 Tax=Amycolatopsis sp. NPDC021455 TaxID=3154901 RepID=UPI0033D6C4AC
MTYDAGPGWTRSADALRLGPAVFEVESYGRSRCVNTERPEGLLGTGWVPGVQEVDTALTRVLREGLLPRLFGPRSMAVGSTSSGRGATTIVIEEGCVPVDPMAAPVVLDLRGYPTHDPAGVAVVFLVGTIRAEIRARILTSVRVMR